MDITQKIYERLSASSELMALLALNAPFYSRKGTQAKANSLIPVGMANASTKPPFVIVQDGVFTRPSDHVIQTTFYLRVYNDPAKAFVEINAISNLIVQLLHLYEFSFEEVGHVKTFHESTLQAAQDQSLNMNFRELRFRITVL